MIKRRTYFGRFRADVSCRAESVSVF